MAKTKISEYSVTNSLNTDVGGIDIDENCLPSNLNDSVREVMVHLKEFQSGVSGDAVNGPVDTTDFKISGTAVTATATELNLLDGATVTTAEINILDGVTANTSEINKLDGASNLVEQTDIGTAPNEVPLNQYLGNLAFQNSNAVVLNPVASAVPSGIGDMVFQLTSDTSLEIKVKGSDGTVRSVALTLA